MTRYPPGHHLSGRVVLVTGGTGTFGATMARRVLAAGCAELRVLSRDEAKQDEMRRRLGDDRLRLYLGDVRDPEAVRRACLGVDHVFHAAALKQVPSCELAPLETVRTNVLGSVNVIEAAQRAGARTVVCLSTDKAVYPISTLGLSKALMEKVAQAYSRYARDTVVCTVRYGNVMCSRGSVIPLFLEQLRAGRPLTVTDPGMTRFLMSVDDALRLVEHALDTAWPGDVFVRKAPASTIEVLARGLGRLVGVDPVIEVVGARQGEKRHETLLGREEAARADDEGEFFRVPVDGTVHTGAGLQEYASHNAERLDEDGVVKVLRETPEIQAALVAAGLTDRGGTR